MLSFDAATLFGVQGLVAVITGGGSGLGLMMAKALEENGAKVYIIGRRLDTLERAAKQGKHGNILPIQGDVTKKDDLASIVEQITKSDGFINVFIANSGISGPTLQFMPEFSRALNVNTVAVWYSVVAFLGLLDAGNNKKNVEQQSQVIATTSIGGFDRIPLPGFAYSASKAGPTFMMKQFATVLVPYGIRSNVIAPGIFPSEMADPYIEHITGSSGFPKSMIPAERPGAPEDMAGAILYLTSKAGAYLHGNVLVTDGGRLSVLPSTY